MGSAVFVGVESQRVQISQIRPHAVVELGARAALPIGGLLTEDRGSVQTLGRCCWYPWRKGTCPLGFR